MRPNGVNEHTKRKETKPKTKMKNQAGNDVPSAGLCVRGYKNRIQVQGGGPPRVLRPNKGDVSSMPSCGWHCNREETERARETEREKE